jgi:hypothetical protein
MLLAQAGMLPAYFRARRNIERNAAPVLLSILSLKRQRIV